MNNHFVDNLAKKLWNYLKLSQPLQLSDCILVLGNSDIRTAQYGTELFIDK